MNHIHRPFCYAGNVARGVSISLSDYLAHPICAYAEAGRCSTGIQALACGRGRVMLVTQNSVFAIGCEVLVGCGLWGWA